MTLENLLKVLNKAVEDELFSMDDEVFLTDINDRVIIRILNVTCPRAIITLDKNEEINNGTLLIGELK